MSESIYDFKTIIPIQLDKALCLVCPSVGCCHISDDSQHLRGLSALLPPLSLSSWRTPRKFGRLEGCELRRGLGPEGSTIETSLTPARSTWEG